MDVHGGGEKNQVQWLGQQPEEISIQINLVLPKPFLYTSDKDISMDVTNMVKLWNSSSIPNDGLILKHTSSVEFSSSFVETNYFSMDTHTIYPPELSLNGMIVHLLLH